MDQVGKLIRHARHLNGGMTQEEASRAAGFKSKVWWGQIEAGVRDPPAGTTARMARVVGLTPRQLRMVGEDAAADELGEILELFGPFVRNEAEVELVAKIRSLSDEQRKALFVLLKVLPASAPVLLAGILGGKIRRALAGAVLFGGAAAAVTTGAVVVLSPGDQPGNGGAETVVPRAPQPGFEVPRPGRRPRPTGTRKPTVEAEAPTMPGSVTGEISTPADGTRPGNEPPVEVLPPSAPGSPPPYGGGEEHGCLLRIVGGPLLRVCVRLPLGR